MSEFSKRLIGLRENKGCSKTYVAKKSPPSIKAERVHFMRRSQRRLLLVGKTRVDI